jgi:camphor 5-monooxygenase
VEIAHVNDAYYNEVVPAHVPASLVHDFNIYDPEYQDLDLFHSFKRLQDIGLPDIFWTRHNGGHWIALRGAAIAEIFRDGATFSSKRPFVPDEQNFETPFFIPLMADLPQHPAYRKVAAAAFSPQRILGFQDEIRALTAAIIADLKPRGHCEFMEDFALQMPVIVILKQLDLPLEDRPRLLRIAAQIVKPPPKGELRDNALQQVFDYLTPILAERRASPGADVLSAIVHSQVDGRAITPEEALGMSSTLLIGGLDSVAATLGFFARHLAESPADRRAIAQSADVIRDATEELLRRFPVTTHGRILTKDIDLYGAPLKCGEHILWAASMYNFDPRIFEAPLTVDFKRRKIGHLSFGLGPHFCMGSMLARLEFKIFFEEWLQQIPEFRVAAGAVLEYRPGINISLQSLPLEWDAA